MGSSIHVVAHRIDDLSPLLASVCPHTDLAQVLRTGCGDRNTYGDGPDYRDALARPLDKASRQLYIPELRLCSGIVTGQLTERTKIKPRAPVIGLATINGVRDAPYRTGTEAVVSIARRRRTIDGPSRLAV